MSYNDPDSIKEWAHDAILRSNIPAKEKGPLLAISLSAANKGLWRGDISDLWKLKGYTTADIPAMYP